MWVPLPTPLPTRAKHVLIDCTISISFLFEQNYSLTIKIQSSPHFIAISLKEEVGTVNVCLGRISLGLLYQLLAIFYPPYKATIEVSLKAQQIELTYIKTHKLLNTICSR